MSEGRCVLVLQDDGTVLGSGLLAPGAEPVVVRWTPDGEELAERLRTAREEAPVSGVRRRFTKTP